MDAEADAVEQERHGFHGGSGAKRPGPMPIARVTLNLPFDVWERAGDISHVRGISKTAVLRVAISLLDAVGRATADGGELVVRHSDGREERIVLAM